MDFELDQMPGGEPVMVMPACETCGKVGCSGLWGAAHCPTNRIEPEPMPYSAPGDLDRTLREMLSTATRQLVAAEEAGDLESVRVLDAEVGIISAALEQAR